MKDRPISLAHLVSHPIQYFAPLYRELAERPEVDLTVYFYSDVTARAFQDAGFGRTVTWDRPLLEGYRHRMLPSAARTDISGRFIKNPNWDIAREVMGSGYDVVWAHGYAHLTTWLTAAAARSHGTQLLLRDEQTLLHSRPLHKRAMKSVALRALYSQASALYIGEQNRRYFRHYGMPEERLYPARYCVDNEFFRTKAAELAPRRREIRASFGIDDDAPVVLFSGKLIAKKQPLMLVEAFARVRAQQPCWLLIAGDGPQRTEAEYLAAHLQTQGVRFAGFLNQTALPAAYAAADMFVLPSAYHETWGLVVNEAMNFRLPVIVSDKVGCGEDLVESGGNGFVVPHGGVDELADAIATLVADPALRARLGARSREIVARYSIEACADGIVAACQALTGHAERSLSAAAA
jgi:glycosyltransferase involved in cell wall biosynthesis